MLDLYYGKNTDNGRSARWDDFSDFRSSMNRLFGEVAHDSNFPGVNVYANDEEIIVIAEVPGVNPDNFDISLQEDVLNLKFSRDTEKPEESSKTLRKERPEGKFSRNIYLPYRAESGKVEATFKNGILEIRMPRAESDKPRKISVKNG